MAAVWTTAGLTPLLAGAWLVARHGFRVEPGPARSLAAAILAWAWLTLGAEVLGTTGHLDRPALVGWSTLGLAVGGILAILRAARPAAVGDPGSVGFGANLATALVVWAGFRRGMVSLIQPVKVVSDGPIYHLYTAARWWQGGRISPVATPFGEVGATYFWANGELWYAWLLTLGGGDRLARIGQVPFLWLGGLAVERLARQVGANPPAARVAALWFVATGPMFLFAFEPNVDSLFVAGYALAACFFLRALAGAVVGRGDLALGALAAGLGMGTKPIGVVFFPPLLLLVLGLVAWRGRGHRARALGEMALVVVPTLALMGYWPARNAWLTGNPLYPLHVEVGGRVWLAGWFGPGAMRLSPYYVTPGDWRAGGDILLGVFDPRQAPAWLLAALGAWAWGRRAGDDEGARRRRWAWGIAALGLGNLAAYWGVIPYRTQQRFAFPAVALLAIPLALLLTRAAWVRMLAVGLLAVHLATPQGWPVGVTEGAIPWDLTPTIPNAIPSLLDLPLTAREATTARHGVVAATGVGVLGAAGLLALARRKGRGAWAIRGLAAGWLAAGLIVAALQLGVQAPMPFPYFDQFYAGWLRLEALAGPQGARVAYAGNKIPYYLMGSRLQNEVRYVPIDAHRDWLLHDYHRNAAQVGEPTTWPNPFPTWDRLRPDYAAWLANLRAEGVDLLVVTRVNIEEGVENVADAERFPIERVWADAHPEAFRPLYGQAGRDPYFKIYQVVPAG